MKSIVMAFTSILCLVLIVLSIFTISNYSTRKNEVEEALSAAMDAAMDNATFTGGFTEEKYMAMIGQLQQDLIVQLNSDGDLEIKILEVDMDNGLLDVEATQTFKWAGVEKSISVRRTIILEQYDDYEADANSPKVCFLKFYSDESMTMEYEELRQGIIPGENVEKPDTSLVNMPDNFMGWYLEGDPEKQIFADLEWSFFTVTEDLNFIARFN